MHRRLLALAPLAAAALLLAGCGGVATGAGSGDGRLSVVAATNVYGQIAQEIGGDAVTVTSLIDSASQDPHTFEASAGDQLAVRDADLLIENGGGYDAFLDALVEGSGSEAPVIVASEHSHSWPGGGVDDHDTSPGATPSADAHVEEEHGHAHVDGADDHGHIEGFNEHVWYDPHTVAHVAEAIAAELGTLDPARAAQFTANAEAFTGRIGEIEQALDAIDAAHAGAGAFATEPVPGYLLAAAGLDDLTPSAFSEAVEEGSDVAPATLLEAVGVIDSGSVRVVVVNAQTGGAETARIVDEATAAGIPVLEFTETLPDGQTYVGWMQHNVDELARALG